jgi:putative heme-binding domain-containing protein
LNLKRDAKRGKEVFEQQCMKCHQLNGRGSAVGPDLAAAQNRPDESLLIDILDPSGTITAGYKTYLIVTRRGKSYTGVLASETATSITLRREKAEQDVILRKDIDQMAAASQSLMPEGLEKEISQQDMANLFGYLREALGPNSNRLLLFDDEPAFVSALRDGEGTATLTSEDKFTGKACLRVTPPQRFAAQLCALPATASWKPMFVHLPRDICICSYSSGHPVSAKAARSVRHWTPRSAGLAARPRPWASTCKPSLTATYPWSSTTLTVCTPTAVAFGS